MVIFNEDSCDNNDNSEYGHVKFISYSGKYPNLCSGRLVLEIDGERIAFSNDYSKKHSRIMNHSGKVVVVAAVAITILRAMTNGR